MRFLHPPVSSFIYETAQQQENKAMEYCQLCDCNVPSANWEEHIDGRRHMNNEENNGYNYYDDSTETSSDTDSLGGYCNLCECQVPRGGTAEHVAGNRHQRNQDDSTSEGPEGNWLSPDEIHYSQDSISDKFSDGVTLEEGIRNILNGEEFTITVARVGRSYVAINNRTLYCCKHAGVGDVRVECGSLTHGRQKRSIDTIEVRGSKD